jgi:phenolic acid decarboxylase
MRRILGFALLFILSSVTLMAAKNSQTFYLSSDVRAGDVQLPRGICEVTWSTPSGSRVQLTIKTDDKKTVTVPALMVEGKEDRAGAVTSVVNGVTYLVEIHTRNAKFVIENGTEASK